MAELNLILGVFLALLPLADFLEKKSMTYGGIVLCLSLGPPLTGLGVLGMMGLVAQTWMDVSLKAALGILFVMLATGRLAVSSSSPYGNRKKVLIVVCGILMLLSATVDGLRAYWH